MYADRYAQPSRFNPVGLTAAVAINAAVIAALVFAAPEIIEKAPPSILETYTVPDEPPPPPEPVTKQIDKPVRPTETLHTPERFVKAPTTPVEMTTTTTFDPPAGPAIGNDPVIVPIEPAPPPPMPLVEPAVDPRYADALQPTYPPDERRAERNGRVTIKVLIGVDGRVKDAQRVSATSDSFWRATYDRALSKWRFKPGTRGGIPVEAWRTMTLTFVMQD